MGLEIPSNAHCDPRDHRGLTQRKEDARITSGETRMEVECVVAGVAATTGR